MREAKQNQWFKYQNASFEAQDACLSVFSQESSHLLIATTIIFLLHTVRINEWMEWNAQAQENTRTIIKQRHIKATEQINNFQYITWR